MARAPQYDCPDCGAPCGEAPAHGKTSCLWCKAQLVYSDGWRGRAALLSLRCPACGVGGNYPEDSHTLRCAYCGARHLVSGAGRPLRLFVPFSAGAKAAAVELQRHFPARATAGDARPVFVPYWRISGIVFQWSSARGGLKAEPFDRSLPAGDFGIGMESLGSRLRVLNQRPFDPAAMTAQGAVLEPTLGREQAEGELLRGAVHALREHPLGRELEHGTVVEQVVSLVWFPFWELEFDGRRICVDGTGAGVVVAPAKRRPHQPQKTATLIPSLVPARCPGCGDDFELDGFEELFFCARCQGSWRQDGAALRPQPFRILAASAGKADPGIMLPLWRLRVALEGGGGTRRSQADFRELVPPWSYSGGARDASRPFFLYVPAWGNRRVPRLSVLGRRWTREQPHPPADPKGIFSRVFRPLFSAREAVELATLSLLGSAHGAKRFGEAILRSTLRVRSSELLLLPCRRGTHEWIDCVSGMAVPYPELAERRFESAST